MRKENRKYQFMEVNTQRRAAGLKDKIPDIQKTLETVQFLEMRKVCPDAAMHATKQERPINTDVLFWKHAVQR